MDDLLSGLNDSFFDAVPSPDPSPVKPKTNAARILPITPKRESSLAMSVEDVDMTALMEGAENWDWDDMEADFLTPKKKQRLIIESSDPGYLRDPCTRCIVEAIAETNVGGRYEKVRVLFHFLCWLI